MKWATNKSSIHPSSSSPISSISRFFSVSWFKSKKKGGNSEKQFEFAPPKGRFYSMDEDDYFWRLSFGDERIQGRKSTGGINPLWYDQDHEFKFSEIRGNEECRNFNEMVSDIKKMRENRGKQRIKTGDSTRKRRDSRDQTSRNLMGFDDEEVKSSNLQEKFLNSVEMASDVKKMGENRGKQRIDSTRKGGDISNQISRKLMGYVDEDEKISNLQERYSNSVEIASDVKKMGENRGKQRNAAGKTEDSTRKQGDMSHQTSRKYMGFDDHEEKSSNLPQRFSNSVENASDVKKIGKNRGKQRIVAGKTEDLARKLDFDDEEEKIPSLQERFSNSVSEWLEIEGNKLKEIKIKSESKKKVIKSHSPRTECKIRALEEKKKTMRTKMRKKKDQVLEENTIFDSFAVVKSSYNPQQDFRESMVEMIREREIESAENLEDLLACYLELNCDEYHDVIIKVFRQVCFELRGDYGSCFDDRID